MKYLWVLLFVLVASCSAADDKVLVTDVPPETLIDETNNQEQNVQNEENQEEQEIETVVADYDGKASILVNAEVVSGYDLEKFTAVVTQIRLIDAEGNIVKPISSVNPQTFDDGTIPLGQAQVDAGKYESIRVSFNPEKVFFVTDYDGKTSDALYMLYGFVDMPLDIDLPTGATGEFTLDLSLDKIITFDNDRDRWALDLEEVPVSLQITP